VAPHHQPEGGDLSRPSQRAAVLNGVSTACQQGRFWVNDPDCLIVRPEVEHREEPAAHVLRYGGLRGSSDRLAPLHGWGLEVTREALDTVAPPVPFPAERLAGGEGPARACSPEEAEAVDLLSSGRLRPPEPGQRRWATRVRGLWRRRGVRAGAVLLVAAAALILLRFTAQPQRRPEQAVAGPSVSASPTPVPPFDRRPGRTPIPAPAQTGDLLSGPLPVTGPPTSRAATRAAALVLGRFCADLGRYVLTLEPDTDGRNPDYHHLGVLVTDRQLTDSGPAMELTLDWDGRAYRWSGPLTLLGGC
jgi:hypothetical protein